MQRVRHIIVSFFCVALLSGCVTSAGVAEFTVYKQAFDSSAAVSTSIIDQLAASERIVERKVRLHPNSIGIDTEFRPQDASVFSELADPPLAAQYRKALNVVSKYNNIMLGYATGQGFAQLESEIFGLASEAGKTAEVISGSAGLASGLTPYLGTLQEIAGFALRNRSRTAFRAKSLEYHDDIVGILETMRDGTKEIFPNLTYTIKSDILKAVSRGQSTKALTDKHRKIRELLSDWVVLMNRNIDALNAVQVAIQNPSLGVNLSGATAEIIQLRSTVDAVRKHLAALNAS